MTAPLNSLARRLVQAELLDEQEALLALQQAQQQNLSLISHLINLHQIPAQKLAEVAAAEFGLPLCDLNRFDLSQAPRDLIADHLLQTHRVIPLAQHDGQLSIALSDPTKLQAVEDIRFHTGMAVTAFLLADDQLEQLLQNWLDKTTELLLEPPTADTGTANTAPMGDLNKEKDDAPVVRFINQMLAAAIRQRASDLHFEPYQNSYRIRFRIDGVLQDIAQPPPAFGPKLAARLKILSNLDISERRLPQDGRMSVQQQTGSVDFRVSTLPTLFGEKIVLRVLDSSQTRLNIKALGMSADQQQAFLAALKKPQGMILVTGPTGSGKTVSLYTGLSILNRDGINISTAEDPVEIHLDGINQVSVNNRIGLDFATALRAFLRQDPDVVMVGEIRDLETANIAIKAAQTGHLVLSTLHTNSAADTLTRLLNMGVAPFNLISSIRMIIAQRLVRRLCDHCKQPLQLSQQNLLSAGFDKAQLSSAQLFQAVGCEQCHNGYKGRIGLYELVTLTPELAQRLLADSHTADLHDAFAKAGFSTLRQAGLTKVLSGETSLDEVYRVTLSD
ncbi:type IV-A pilus assembly ATPase PilB [Saccharospirillum sp. HFRX-1]|uniref:type IV-A pilus assembly ATPase PilB n=1 Tax=unclassified Saccharospirillum TaxID=2633430 RepID=UPI003713AF54